MRAVQSHFDANGPVVRFAPRVHVHAACPRHEEAHPARVHARFTGHARRMRPYPYEAPKVVDVKGAAARTLDHQPQPLKGQHMGYHDTPAR